MVILDFPEFCKSLTSVTRNLVFDKETIGLTNKKQGVEPCDDNVIIII